MYGAREHGRVLSERDYERKKKQKMNEMIKRITIECAVCMHKIYLLNRLQLSVAWIAYADIKLKAHYRYINAICGALIAYSMPAMAAMMLPNAYSFVQAYFIH